MRETQSNIRPGLFTPPDSPLPTDFNRLSPPVARKTTTSLQPNVNQKEPDVPQITTTTPQPSTNKRRRQSSEDPIQTALEKAILADANKSIQNEQDKNDPDELICRSLVSSFKALSTKKNKQAKIKVMQVLLDMED